ncbi:MAG: ribosome maturation factor RimP [Proteobacteria bacterium]|nr:ribosome maturation factor RimP [Pseudomonadota bacterium]
MNRQHYDKIIDLINPKITLLGYECVDVEWDAKEETLRVYIDRDGGVKMEDCLRVNDVLIEANDLDQLVHGDYRLEISSPGVERPLRLREHFSRFVGQRVKVRLNEKTQDRVEGTGKLLGIDQDDIVSLELPIGVWNFPFHVIRRANLVFEW